MWSRTLCRRCRCHQSICLQSRLRTFAAEAPATDLESRIGSHWLNRIGISAVLIGVSYFLKFAFDNNWIGPTGRVSIGLLAGIAVIVWSESFRNRGYKIFSYSLKAVGVGVLYLSLWAAFQMYGLIPSSIAFLAMVIVTASTATLAIKQDAEILAAIALTGGFATPLLLSTGQNREIQLFSYVALLGSASVALVAVRPWRRLLVLSYAGTLVLYIAWYAEYYRRNEFGVTFSSRRYFSPSLPWPRWYRRLRKGRFRCPTCRANYLCQHRRVFSPSLCHGRAGR